MKISILKSKQIRCLKELKKCLRNGKLYFPVMSGKGAPHHRTVVSILSLCSPLLLCIECDPHKVPLTCILVPEQDKLTEYFSALFLCTLQLNHIETRVPV